MKGYKNALVYVKEKGVIRCDVAVENGKIVKIGKDLDITSPYPYKDGRIVVPGFIDEHIHGAVGADAMDKTENALSLISEALKKEGTTSFLATTMTQSEENIISALSAVKSFMEKGGKSPKCGAKLIGVHLEGPFISEKHIGAQPLKYLKDPDPALFMKFQAASGNNIKLITLAPEERNAELLINAAVKSGATVSAGHTDAGEKEISAAINAGLTSITHTYNAMRPVHHREIGTVGSAFLFDELFTEIICDGIHVSPSAVKILLKNKPKDKVILITDAMRAKGSGDGESELGGQKVFVKNGEARLENGALAGSVLKMNVAVKNMVTLCGEKFENAIDFATYNPAHNLRLNGKGEIKEGYDADFTVLDEEFNVTSTIVDGELCFSTEKEKFNFNF